MSNDGDRNSSAAFDALLDKNRQRLDALSGKRPEAAKLAQSQAPQSASPSGVRRTGYSDGIKFSFYS